jgi:hypothetical protein
MPITGSELNMNMLFSSHILMVELGSGDEKKEDGSQGVRGRAYIRRILTSRPSPPSSLLSESSLSAPLPSSLPLHLVPHELKLPYAG